MQNELDNGVNRENLDEHEDDILQPHAISLGKSQKIAVFVLAFFTLVLIFVGVSNIGSKIKQPIGQFNEEDANKSQIKDTPTYASSDSDESLKEKDTDEDGLSDWDELNVYKTSPYLEDSDSDGFSDGAEINSGNNPNCPNGKDCGVYLDATKIDEPDIIVNAPSAVNQGSVGNIQTSDQDLQVILSGESDAETLRKALLGYGIDKTMLDQISDEELLKGYKESLKQ